MFYIFFNVCELDVMCEYILETELKNINFKPLTANHKTPTPHEFQYGCQRDFQTRFL